MRLDEYVELDGLALAELVRRGATTPEALAACAREGVERFNGTLNAVIEVFDPPEAGGPVDAPFHGVPFLVKDLVLQVRGRKCELGSELARGLTAQYDTHLMQRFRAAGLHTLGRTTTPELGYCATTEARLYGPTRNPWDPSRMPGGSSGGSAAAVAAGIVPVAHANDGGGSIRIPAACCGLVGLKPTRGRTPLGPDAGEALFGLAIEFAVSRTVRDSAALLDAVQGPMPGDKYVIAPPARPYAQEIVTPPGRLRIGCTARPWSGTAVDPQVAAALETTAARLADLGHEVVEGAPPLDYARYIEATLTLWSANVAHWADLIAERTGRAPGPDTLQATTLAVYEHGRRLRASDVFDAVDTMNVVSRAAAPFFERHDLLLTPTCASPALPIGEMNADDPALDAAAWTEKVFAFAPFTALFNMTGQPAISLPLARSDAGLPIGMQFVGRWGDEATLLRMAAALEQAFPWPRLAPLATGGGARL